MLPLDLSLTANEEEVFSRVGRTVFAKSVSGEIEVTGYSAGGILVGKARMVQGNRYVMAADFTRLQIKDLSGAANSVQLLAGLGDFSEAGLGTIDSITNPIAQSYWDQNENDGTITNRAIVFGAGTTHMIDPADCPDGYAIVHSISLFVSGGSAGDLTDVRALFAGNLHYYAVAFDGQGHALVEPNAKVKVNAAYFLALNVVTMSAGAAECCVAFRPTGP